MNENNNLLGNEINIFSLIELIRSKYKFLISCITIFTLLGLILIYNYNEEYEIKITIQKAEPHQLLDLVKVENAIRNMSILSFINKNEKIYEEEEMKNFKITSQSLIENFAFEVGNTKNLLPIVINLLQNNNNYEFDQNQKIARQILLDLTVSQPRNVEGIYTVKFKTKYIDMAEKILEAILVSTNYVVYENIKKSINFEIENILLTNQIYLNSKEIELQTMKKTFDNKNLSEITRLQEQLKISKHIEDDKNEVNFTDDKIEQMMNVYFEHRTLDYLRGSNVLEREINNIKERNIDNVELYDHDYRSVMTEIVHAKLYFQQINSEDFLRLIPNKEEFSPVNYDLSFISYESTLPSNKIILLFFIIIGFIFGITSIIFVKAYAQYKKV